MLEGNEQDDVQYATLQQNVLTALRSHFVAKRDRSVANLNNYLNNPAGIGEHPDIVVILAGDQLYLDMDLSKENLPPGTRLAVGGAIIEVTEPPHTGCKKFAARFGKDAVVFVNTGLGKTQNFRGICAKVIQSGDIKTGDLARKA